MKDTTTPIQEVSQSPRPITIHVRGRHHLDRATSANTDRLVVACSSLSASSIIKHPTTFKKGNDGLMKQNSSVVSTYKVCCTSKAIANTTLPKKR